MARHRSARARPERRAAPFDRDKAERARLKFIETPVLIDAIERAIEGEEPRARRRGVSALHAFTRLSKPP
jgi:hypothetical protein